MEIKKLSYPDVLAARYATAPLVNMWSPEARIILGRKLWIAAMKAQRELGVDIPPEAIEAYERVMNTVDLDAIKQRELKTRQDVKAQIEIFNELAGGHEFCHMGFTSRDQTDNTEQLVIRDSLAYIRDRTIAVLSGFAKRATEYAQLEICGRSHDVPGQTITLGKRFANFADELLVAFEHLEHVIESYPLRGIKGAMGTQQDMITLLGCKEKALKFEKRMAAYLGFKRVMDSTGQVYPRSIDHETVATLFQLSGAIGNFAKMIRLMAGMELAHEGFKKGQTGSSAMPHKMNSRTCERINALIHVLGGYEDMVKGMVGDQWFEGDVSCSVIRRVALPGAFFALEGIYESALTILKEMEVFPGMISAELSRYLPLLSSSMILMEACKKGMGRDTAHEKIKKHATEAVRQLRLGQGTEGFLKGLSAEEYWPLSYDWMMELIKNPDHGAAVEQVERICNRVVGIEKQYPGLASYMPQPLL